MAGRGWRICESGEWAAGRVEIPQGDSGAMDDAAGGFEILGTARAFRSRGSVSGSGMPLGLDRGSDKACGSAGEDAVLIRAYGIGNAGVCCGGGGMTHVDASRKAVAWARENQGLSGLSERPIRWIVEDALTFVRREARRGNRYDAMVIDPPKFGRGPNGEMWKLDESLPESLSVCGEVLSASPVFILLNVYTTVLTRGRIEKEAEAFVAG